MKKRPLWLIVAVIAVSGCVGTGNPTGPEGGPIWWRGASEEQRVDFVTRRCAGYGFADGTPERAQCVANEIPVLQCPHGRRLRPLPGIDGRPSGATGAVTGGPVRSVTRASAESAQAHASSLAGAWRVGRAIPPIGFWHLFCRGAVSPAQGSRNWAIDMAEDEELDIDLDDLGRRMDGALAALRTEFALGCGRDGPRRRCSTR